MATFYRVRAGLTAVGNSHVALMTTYWDSTGGSPSAVVTEALARVRAFWNSMQGSMANGCALTINPVADEIEETTGALVAQQAGAPPAAVSFSGSGDALPFANQALLRLATNSFVNNRRVQGRINIPYLTELQSSSGVGPTAGLIVNITTAAALLGTTVVTPIGQRVWHRPPVGSASGLSTPVIARTVSPTWAVLRSRRG